MYILESIQEFDGKKIGIYNLNKQTTRRVHRAENQIIRKGTPQFAIFISTPKITKGEHRLYLNAGSYIIKSDISDSTQFESNITI